MYLEHRLDFSKPPATSTGPPAPRSSPAAQLLVCRRRPRRPADSVYPLPGRCLHSTCRAGAHASSSPARLALPAIVRSASVFPASGEVFPANSTALLVLDHRFHYQPPHELILPLPLPPACLAGAGASCCRGRVQCNGKMRNAATSSVKRGQNRFKSATSAQRLQGLCK